MIGEGGENANIGPKQFIKKAFYFVETPIRNRRFEKLRAEVNREVDKNVLLRIRTNPHPTEEEYRLGSFFEGLEPQVAHAVREFNRKGYQTSSSGFYGNYGEIQVIDGHFELGEPIIKQLNEIGVKYVKKGLTWVWIQFDTNKDMKLMKEKWDQIASLLPDKGKPADPSLNDGSESFRKKYK